MSRSSRWVVLGAVLLGSALWVGCSDDDGLTPDAGADQAVTDAGVAEAGHDLATDAGQPGDTGSPDQGPDQGSADQGTGCNASLDLAPLTLASAYCVSARVAAPAASAFAFDPTRLWTYEAGSAARSFVVRERALDLGKNSVGTPADVISFTVSGTQNVFAGLYLAAWPGAGSVTVGYTLKDFSGGLRSGKAGATPVEVSAKGNFDVAYLDADTLLINGQGAGSAEDGQGLYVYKNGSGRQLIKDVGSFSSLVSVGSSVVFVGGFTTANEVWAFSVAEIKAAISANTTLSGSTDGDLIYSGDLKDGIALGDSLVYIDDDFVSFKAVRRLPVTVTGDSVSKGTAVDVITPPVGAAVKVDALAATVGWLGVRLTGGAGEELALIREK
jgi:hypothetical protein